MHVLMRSYIINSEHVCETVIGLASSQITALTPAPPLVKLRSHGYIRTAASMEIDY